MRRLLLGDEAIAQGALDAGLSGVYAYPGTPSTEITEFIQESPLAKERNVHRRWSTNEKTAMEAALGMSYMGKRALVCMKHVGLNVAADPLFTLSYTGVNAGMIIAVADDAGKGYEVRLRDIVNIMPVSQVLAFKKWWCKVFYENFAARRPRLHEVDFEWRGSQEAKGGY